MFNRKNGTKSPNSSFAGIGNARQERNDSPRTATSPARLIGNVSSLRIDPEILLDTQSNGLSSRIVKYYEESQKVPRTPRPVYNKPGQFPIVHLKRNEIVYSTKRNNPLSVIKIAPPDKSVADRNIRLNILRQGLSTPAEDYREPKKVYDNEPLTPTTNIETIPTRSVLDALTEISRKRIHTEDYNGERTKKKHCNECTEVDGPLPDDIRAGQSKRQREKISPPSPSEISIAESSKKKICRDSVDILSSLSSSVRLLNPKRRIEDVLAGEAKRTHYTRPRATVEPQKRSPIASQVQRDHTDSPPTQRVSPIVSPPVAKSISPKVEPKPTPKVTLFNQNYDKIQERVASDTEDDQEGRSMNLVRPKQSSHMLVKDKEASTQGKKSKLAMMLSYLSRNFEDESVDVPDSKAATKDETPAVVEKSPELPKAAPVIFETPKTSRIPESSLAKSSTDQKEAAPKDGPVATSTPMFKFGTLPADANNKVESVVKASNPLEEKVKEVENKIQEKKVEEPATASAEPTKTSPLLLLPDSTKPPSSLPLSTPINFGFNPPATSTTSSPSAVAKSPFSLLLGSNTKSPFTSGISGSTTKSPAKETTGDAPKPLLTSFSLNPPLSTTNVAPTTAASAVNPPAFMSNFTSTAPTSSTVTSTAASNPPAYSTNSLFTFKPVVSSTSSVASSAAAPLFPAFSAPGATKTGPADGKFVFGGTTLNAGAKAEGMGFEKPQGVITFGESNVTKTTAPGNTFTSTLTNGGFAAGVFGGFSTQSTSVPAFGTSNTITTTAPVFGASNTVSTPVFGASTTTPSVFGSSNPTSTPVFGATTTTNTPAPVTASIFGATTTTAPVTAPVFGATTTTPVFGASNTPSFGAPTTTTASFGLSATTSLAFGGQTAANPNFGGTTTTPQPFAFGAPKTSTDTKSLFTFGATTTSSQPAQNATFSFSGAKPQVATSSFSFDKKSPFDAAPAGAPSIFGNAANPGNSSVFGGMPTTTASAPAFGSSSSIPVFGAVTTAAATTTNSIFSGTFGQTQPKASFGTGQSTFGTTSAGSQFSFGQAAATTVAQTAPSAGIFGGVAQAQSTPSTFGAVAEPESKPFNFGASTAAPFQFGASSAPPNASPFNFTNNQQSTPTPAFGAATPSATFAFGQTESKTPAPAFGTGVTVFGGVQQPNAAAPPAFGTPTPPAFNFTGSAPSTPQQQPFAFGAAAPQGGFSIGTGGPAQRRPYRHAIRRNK